MEHLQAGVQLAFTVLPQPAAFFQSGEGSFHDPALGQYHKCMQFIALDDLNCGADSALANVEAAQAAYDDARLQLSYTVIHALAGGRIGNKTVEVGQRVQPGQPLLAMVEPEIWIVANFKETQLAHMKDGQPAEVQIDRFPEKRFIGRVQSFSPATGANFSLLPPENATGNFVKVVQRVPVKVVFDPDSVRGCVCAATSAPWT